MPNKITRESLISPDIVKVAILKKTMFDVSGDGESVVEVPIPESIKATEIIPEGYSVDHHLDPSIVIYTLAKNNITTIEQLSDDLFTKNVAIAPSSVVEGKREAIENSLIEMKMEDAAQAEKSGHSWFASTQKLLKSMYYYPGITSSLIDP